MQIHITILRGESLEVEYEKHNAEPTNGLEKAWYTIYRVFWHTDKGKIDITNLLGGEFDELFQRELEEESKSK